MVDSDGGAPVERPPPLPSEHAIEDVTTAIASMASTFDADLDNMLSLAATNDVQSSRLALRDRAASGPNDI